LACLSITRLSNYFKSLGVRKSKKTLANYLRYLEESYYAIRIRRFGFSRRASIQQPRKVFPIDTAYFRRKSMGSMMECAVAVELMRRGLAYSYFKNGDYEVDFVVETEPRELIQVTYASAMDEVDRRELRALLRARQALGGGKLRIISWDLEGEVEVEGLRVTITPLWMWLMNPST